MPDISKLLWAESVAVVGASPDTTILRGILFDVICRQGYAGRIYPINPNRTEIAGHKAYPTVNDLPEPVDLAVLAIPAGAVIDEVRRCGEAGIRAAAIVASGFAEQAGAEGVAMQHELSRVIAEYDMAVTGPNSLGFVNFAKSLAPTFSPAISRANLPLMPDWHEDGGRLAVIAQSGAIGYGMYDRGRLRELPFRYVVTTGNEAGLRAFDIVDYMLDEGETQVFLMFLEDIRDGAQFRRVAAKALEQNKPIIAVKIGRSEASQESAASHTGAMAGSDRVNRAVLAEYGITLADDIDQLVDTAAAFFHNRSKPPKGRRIGIAAGSGGGGGWMADLCDGFGLEVPVLDQEARRLIDAVLPEYGSSRNPVDGTAQAVHRIGYAELMGLTMGARNIDAGILVTTARQAHHYAKERDKFIAIGSGGDKPLVTWSYTMPSQETMAFFASAGVPLLTDTLNAASAMAALVTYSEARARFNAPLVPASESGSERTETGRRIRFALFEYAARQLLADHAIGSMTGRLVDSRDAAVAAARAIGGDVVMKIQSPDIAHKTEADGVRLAVSGDDLVAAAYDDLIAAAGRYDDSADIAGVLIEPMAKPGVELIVGIQNDSVFGPMVLVGLGGIYAEIMDDVVLASPTADRDTALAILRRLKGAGILFGARGKQPADVSAVADLIVALSKFAVTYAEDIEAIDLNPVIVHPEGQGLSVVDALIEPRN